MSLRRSKGKGAHKSVHGGSRRAVMATKTVTKLSRKSAPKLAIKVAIKPAIKASVKPAVKPAVKVELAKPVIKAAAVKPALKAALKSSKAALKPVVVKEERIHSHPTMCLHCHLIVEMFHERGADPVKGAWQCPRCGHKYLFSHWKIKRQARGKTEAA
jgi:DNA-directed RNA polymerase subunit RPC12/RpoP